MISLCYMMLVYARSLASGQGRNDFCLSKNVSAAENFDENSRPAWDLHSETSREAMHLWIIV